MGSSEHQAARYALGHSDAELERLEAQPRIVDPVTRRFWAAAGVQPGMRVLDVGCSAGHTTMLLAQMVGELGQVVGIDTLLDRMLAEARATDSIGVGHLQCCAYCIV